MNLFEKIENFKNLFKQKKFDELINQIDEIEEKNSFIINIYAAAKLLRNNIEKKDKLSALQHFEKAYLMDNQLELAYSEINRTIALYSGDKNYFIQYAKVCGELHKENYPMV